MPCSKYHHLQVFSAFSNVNMKFLGLFSLAVLSASSALAQIIPPKFYPPNGTYYIYNVQYKRIFDNANGVATEGNPIIGWPAHPQTTPENQQVGFLY